MFCYQYQLTTKQNATKMIRCLFLEFLNKLVIGLLGYFICPFEGAVVVLDLAKTIQ